MALICKLTMKNDTYDKDVQIEILKSLTTCDDPLKDDYEFKGQFITFKNLSHLKEVSDNFNDQYLKYVS